MNAVTVLTVWALLGIIHFGESNSFDYLMNGDATAVLQKLKEKGQTTDSIFTARNSQEMLEKKNLPYLGPWIKKTIRFEFQEKNPQNAFQQVVDAEKHLKVSGLGCKHLKCKNSVVKVGRTYDEIIKVARRLSSESVRQTIQMMKFIRNGVKDANKRDESLNKCLPIAEALARGYGALEKQASILKTVAYQAVLEIEKDNLKISKKQKEDAIILDKLKRILNQAKKIEEERCNSRAMTSISSVLELVGGFKNNLDNDFETALKAMSAASVSMKIVKTMALDIQEFWDDQALLIRKIVEKDVKIDGLEGIQGFEVNIAEVGLYWLVFGTISATADNIMIKKYGKLQPMQERRLMAMSFDIRGSPRLTIDTTISSHVFGVIYFKMNKNEKRKIASEGSKLIAASKAVIDKLNKDNLAACACWYRSGEGVGQQVFIGADIEQNDCEKRCRDRREASPSINGVTWEIKGKRCYCKKNMNKISGNVRYKSCFLKVDGKWASWGSWGACTTSKPAMRTRKRSCFPPKAQRYGGRDCLLEMDSETVRCPVDGSWGSWGSWGACSRTCGPGIQTRSRSCSPPRYQRYGGRDCSGRESDLQTNGCSEISYCPVNYVVNSRIDCWLGCGLRGGSCGNVCGSGGFCCRRGWSDCPYDKRVVATSGHHTCVKYGNANMRPYVVNSSINCWFGCGMRGGSCSKVCGSGGFCCRLGWSGCPHDKQMVATKYHHTCIKDPRY